MQVAFPSWSRPLWRPYRYKVAYGGRGGSKSWTFARCLLSLASSKPLRILCTREIQASIADSVHKLLSDQIGAMGLGPRYRVTQTGIYGVSGSEFLFSGLRNNITKIKSFEGVDIVWCEEAEKISENSWSILIPTIRKRGSEIWVSFNPDLEGDPTYKRFILSPPPGSVVIPVSYGDNPWLPEELQREKDYLASVDPDAYAHVWGGACRTNSNTQILKGKCSIEAFTPGENWDGPYFGADWGFANDPTTLIKCWIHNRKLYIEHEVYQVGLEVDHTPAAFDQIPDAKKYTIRGDNSRPETISYLQRHGYPNIQGCEKWPGSVEDGIAILRSFEQIVIHPRCTHTAEESRLYSYKVDRLSGDALPAIEDKHNHCIDAIRYGLGPIIKNSGFGLLDFYAKKAQEAQEKRQ